MMAVIQITEVFAMAFYLSFAGARKAPEPATQLIEDIMKNQSGLFHRGALITLAAAFATVSIGSAFAKSRHPGHPKPVIAAAEGDTLNMTCADATTTVRNKSKVVLRTSSNIFDLYVRDPSVCTGMDEDAVPAFVRTRDSRTCNIGFTCDDRDSE